MIVSSRKLGPSFLVAFLSWMRSAQRYKTLATVLALSFRTRNFAPGPFVLEALTSSSELGISKVYTFYCRRRLEEELLISGYRYEIVHNSISNERNTLLCTLRCTPHHGCAINLRNTCTLPQAWPARLVSCTCAHKRSVTWPMYISNSVSSFAGSIVFGQLFREREGVSSGESLSFELL